VAKVKRRTLREKTTRKYIDAGGVYCPYCENENLNWSSVEIEGAGHISRAIVQNAERGGRIAMLWFLSSNWISLRKGAREMAREKREKPVLESIIIKHMADECPDLPWLGEYSDEEQAGAILSGVRSFGGG